MNFFKPDTRLFRLLLCIVLVAMLIPAAVALPTTAFAVTPSQGAIDEAGLEVHISFPNDQLLAEWYVHVKRTQGGKVIFDRTKQMTLDCKQHGDIQIEDESATFRAVDRSYIACTLPSLRKMAYAMTEDEPGGPIRLAQECDCKNAWVAAKIRLGAPTGASAPTLYDNPLFYHPDFQYYVPEVNSAREPLLHVMYDGVAEPLSDLFLPQKWNTLWTGIDGAEFLANLGSWGDYFFEHDVAKLVDARHWANGDVLRYANEPSEFRLTTDETTIYIGHSPIYQTYSDVVIKHLDWDPPCFGAGGG